MIREVRREDIPECVGVIKRSFQTVSDDFGLTAENAPRFTAFATTEERLYRQLDHALKTAMESGCDTVNISIVEENKVLRKWYEQNGAIHTGTKKFDFFPFTCGYLKISVG